MRSRLIAKNQSEHGQAALDAYTPFHFGVGVIAGVLGVSPVKAALALTALKIGVASYEHGAGHALFSRSRGESSINELCDLLAELAGVDAGAALRAKWATPATLAPAPTPTPTPAALPATPAAGLGIFR
jgi:hypothetical protein